MFKKEIILNILGFISPVSFSIASFIDFIKPSLVVLGLIASIGVAITTIFLNIKKIKKLNQDSQINDLILKK